MATEARIVSSTKLYDLQLLRACAAAMVAMSHIGKEVIDRSEYAGSLPLNWLFSGVFGVDLFFVISGFIMILITASPDSPERSPIEFLVRRFIRIAPVYWIYLSLFLISASFAANLINHSHFSAPYITASYFFFPYPSPLDGDIEPAFPLGWTLNYEMYFYMIFAFMLLLPRRYIVVALLTYFGVSVVAGMWLDTTSPAFWYWTRSNVLEFCFGAVIAWVYSTRWRFSLLSGSCVLILGIVLWQAVYHAMGLQTRPDLEYAPDPSYRGLLFGVPAALIVAGLLLNPVLSKLCQKGRIASFCVLVGDASFSLYLSHMFVVRAITLVFPRGLLGEAYPVVYIILTFSACVVVAIMSFKFLEQPSNSVGRKALALLSPNKQMHRKLRS